MLFVEKHEAILKTNSARLEGFWMKSEEHSVRFEETLKNIVGWLKLARYGLVHRRQCPRF